MNGRAAARIADRSRASSPLRLLARRLPLLAGIAGLALPRLLALNPAEAPADYIATRWDAESGLPHNAVRAIFQTRDGYLWVGTQQGLARFDGIRFTTFTQHNTPALLNNQITSFAQTRDGSLWIGTSFGLTRYHDGRFVAYTEKDGVKGTTGTVNAVCVAPDESLWIGTQDGITRWVDGRFVQDIDTSAYNTRGLRDIWVDREKRIWVALGSDLLRYEGGRFRHFDRSDGLPGEFVQRVVDGPEGKILAVTQKGSYRLDHDRFVPFAPDTPLATLVGSSAVTDRDGNLWIGSTSGLQRFTKGKAESYAAPSGNNPGVVYAIYEDREACVWVGGSTGLYRLTNRRGYSISTKQGLAGTLATAVTQTRNGAIWAAAWGGGVDRMQDGQVTHYGTSLTVTAICEGKEGVMWLGTRASALQRLENGQITSYTYAPGVPTSRPVTALHLAEDGELLIGISKRGLLRRKDGVIVPVPEAAEIAAETVWTINHLRDGRLVLGTSKGLYERGTDRRWRQVKISGLPASVGIRSLLDDPDGTLWLATDGAGLVRFTHGTAYVYDSKRGMVDDTLFSVVDDGVSALWVSSARGLARIRRNEFEELDANAAATINGMTFGRQDGLFSGSTSGNGNPSSVRLQDGRIMTATDNGIAVIDPTAIQANSKKPTVVIEAVVADDRDLPITDSLMIPAGTNRVEIHFTALSLVAPERLRFRYQLQGSDPGWIEANHQRVATYTHLAPGRYTFRVLASNNDGIWNNVGASLALEMQPLLYQTAAFRVAMAAAIAAVLAAVVGWRVRQLKRQQQALARANAELDQRVRERTAELSRSNEELAETYKRLMVASRASGMAEVATGVLHNVGNVLNSVNVATSCIAAGLRNSKIESVNRIAALLRQHEHDIPRFLSEDSRGRKVPEFLESYARHATEEQQRLLQEVAALRKNIDHIKDIVAMQQAYATTVGVVEGLDPVTLVEDALRMNAGSLTRHEIRVERAFEPVPQVLGEQAKILQILINLIRNAKYACDEGGSPDKCITLRVRSPDAQHVQIVVQDNGVGIPAENLSRIFQHGFTTRANGHGFGLHSAAIAAREMKGSISVHSEGTGTGATFTLELPVRQTRDSQPDGNEAGAHGFNAGATAMGNGQHRT